jgi:RAB protein geranylgeranyltransferase component A
LEVYSLHVKMESLSDTLWDVVISGTGLQQSLLAL